MPISVTTLAHVAALAAAVPRITVSLDTPSGSTIIVGDFPEASMCTHAFRQFVQQWPVDAQHQPCVDAVHFDGAQERGPVLATGPSRWFVSELAAQPAVAALRAARPDGPRIDTRVRFDPLLGLSVVRMASDQLSETELDEAATLAYAACLAEHLIWQGTRVAG
ncbi:hypothetical protein [Demequina aestuarii]|uniref:hypothetical protein n=1 Tax=Demequina aestuarii TaxID=327095 RepID=UPI0007839808|nr:hypothetical protein [Demequina aestuarii]